DPGRWLPAAATRDRARGALDASPAATVGGVRVGAAGWIAVGLLGGVAAAARFVVDYEVTLRWRGAFPLGILAVNLVGALAIGLVAGSTLDGEAATIVSGGVIGSFTTFSTWILDSHR